MALAAGTRIGSYEIGAALGAGGMGEVYRARDTKLHRDVALKLLPEAVARDPDRLARLKREAQVLAALNHPHIAQIYGFEDSGDAHALVMELVEGPTLADVLSSHAARGGVAGISLPDALHVAREIADALEAAHERGIIHRDLKPANVSLQSADGATDVKSCRVKVLDFGLAKAVGASGATTWNPADSPTETSPNLTEMGVILGTATYMSPEQARGRAVDRRADIWAFGVVLFEMLAGQPPFRGEDVSDTLANVLKREPDWDALPADVPARVRQVLRACLQKSVKARLADMQDVRLALDGAFETPAPAHVGPPGRRMSWMIAAAVGAIAGAVVAAAGVSWWIGRAPEHSPASRLSFVPPSSRPITFPGRPGRSIALSPDGTEIVYLALARDAGTPGSRQQLELRTLSSRTVSDLPGTLGATQPFFSPDGRWVAFFTTDGNLKKVSLAGGNPVTLASGINNARWSFGVWLPDDSIVFSAFPGLIRVPADGGTLSAILSADATKNERGFAVLTAVPSGRAVLFTVAYGSRRQPQVDVLRLDTGERLPVLDNASSPLIMAGHLLFWRGDAPLVVPFDEKTLKVTGPARPLVDAVAVDNPDSLAPVPEWAASATGALAYVAATDTSNELGLVARDGTFQSIGLSRGRYDTPRVSPDGRTLAFTVQTALQSTIGFFDFDRRSVTKLASAGETGLLAWHPDGRSLAVQSSSETTAGMGIVDLDGRTRTFIADPTASTLRRNASWSPDGKILAFTEQTTAGENIWAVTTDDPSSPKPVVNGADAFGPAFSPDGLWLAYTSDESGQREVYVRRYPDGQRYTVSTSGGLAPVWNRNGKEIFFQGQAQGASSLMAVAVTPEGETLRLGQPLRLFDLRVATADGVIAQYALSTNSGTRYDIMPDGQHFVMVRGEADMASSEIVVVPHWVDELRPPAP